MIPSAVLIPSGKCGNSNVLVQQIILFKVSRGKFKYLKNVRQRFPFEGDALIIFLRSPLSVSEEVQRTVAVSRGGVF